MARMRDAARAGLPAAGLAGWPLAACAASSDGGAGALLLAVVLGGALAIGGALLLMARRDRAAALPLRVALASTAGWWRADADGRIVEIHAGHPAATTDLPALGGRLLADLPEAEARTRLQQAVAAGAPFRDIEVLIGGSALVLAGSPVRAPAGTLLGYAGTLQPRVHTAPAAGDSPELQADLAESNRRLADRTRELDNAVRELDSFAYSVSHDLRAPLRVVDGFATIVLEDYSDRGKPLDDVGRDHLRRIVAASQRMNTMIDTLLGLSRMTSRELARERVDLSQIARELSDDLQSQDAERRPEFVIAAGLRADGDATLLRLVLQNLLGNAYKFTARNRDARIEFGVRSDGSTSAFYVKDNGAGFDMRFAEKMFGLFQRLHSANEFPGTGVGLATVQKIVRRHGGRVWAEAVPAPNEGHGATFFFTLWEGAEGVRDR